MLVPPYLMAGLLGTDGIKLILALMRRLIRLRYFSGSSFFMG
jgi:hypothetical protein